MAEAERAFLGLTHNPFVQPAEGFFERGDRKTHLEQLRHLSQWSRRVLLVTGPEGVGKTALYRQLAASLEPRVKAARINGALVTASREVMMAIAQGFGLAAPADANSQLIEQLVTDHVGDQAESDRQCLVVIDDAHLLEPKVIDELIELVQDCALHVVLFGEVRLVPGVERSASRQGVGWHEIRLTGFGDADARDYLEWRFQQARYRGRIPFTDPQVREVVRLSEGLPGKINQMANVLLVKLETGEGEEKSVRFPRLHGTLLVLLLALIGLAWILLADDSEPTASDDLAGEPATENDGDPVVGDPVAGDPIVALPGVVERMPLPVQLDVLAVAAGNEDLTSAELAAAEIRPDQPAVASSLTEPTPDPEPASEAGPAPAAEEQSAPEPSVEPDVVSRREVAKPVPDRPTAIAQSSPPVEAKPEPDAPGSEPERDSSWLLGQDPAAFTIQLVTLSSIERANAFVAQQQRPQDFAIYQLERDGRVLHVVIFGLFESRAAALAVADNLPPETGRVQPWVRPMGQVQSAARISTLN